MGSSIIGIGTDIVEIARLEQSIARTGDAFLQKVYTPAELTGAPEKSPRRMEYLAGRWAAKEALAKALRTGITSECRLNEIETLNEPQSRAPSMTLSGDALKTARRLGVKKIHLSIAHEKAYAVATVLLEK